MDIVLETAKRLAEIFPDYMIVRENIAQGFKPGTFYIHEIKRTTIDGLTDQERREHFLSIVYFPRDEKKAKQENTKISSNLIDNLKNLDSVKLRLQDREITESDGTLVMTFRVRYLVRWIEERTKIETLETNGGLSDGKNETNGQRNR